MTENQFKARQYKHYPQQGKVTWSSPSNIALVKYWGKKENQIPANASISFTLEQCRTTTSLSYKKKENTDYFSFDVFFEGQQKDDFKPKIKTFFKRIEHYLPFLKNYHFTIKTSNTFPHSSGIASSASGFSALAMCLMSIEKSLSEVQITDEFFIQKASFLARLGSGSACRSLQGNLIVWGQHHDIDYSSNLYGVKYPFEVHNNYKNFQDTILLVDKGEKQVSSSVGHDLMHNHPFAQQRFKQAGNNLSKLITVFKKGDLKSFISIVESEALSLHAMMMMSNPYFILMKPNTLEIINKIWRFRKETGLSLCFTLDAGANVHVLYPDNEAELILEFIKNELVVYCQNGHYICDRIGFGAKKC